jgi:peptidoglycan glycosyltransferase
VNRPIVRLFGLVVLLFALLVAFTSRWTIFEASALRENKLNARSLLEQQRVDRGEIVAADGTVLARSVKREEGVYERTYPTGSLFGNTLGYYFTNLGSSGLERYRSTELNGQTPSNLQRILDELQGKKQRGDKVVTSLDPAAQKVAMDALAGHHGAVVALEPRSGSVTVMASSPPYDPNAVASASGYEKLARDNEEKPLVNRAVQFGYAPGSTFKVLTATAAIDTGEYTPQSLLSGRNEIVISGTPLKNDEKERSR